MSCKIKAPELSLSKWGAQVFSRDGVSFFCRSKAFRGISEFAIFKFIDPEVLILTHSVPILPIQCPNLGIATLSRMLFLFLFK